MEKDDIERIIENHQHYLNRDCENWQSVRADLSFVDLSNMDISYANLRDANLQGANLENSRMHRINLTSSNLKNANLRDANLSDANLRDANLSDAILIDTNLCNANLCNVNLYGANLSGTDLEDANLYNANLFGSYLEGVNLRNTRLEGANLRTVDLSDIDLGNVKLDSANLQHTEIPDQYKIKGEMLTQDIIGYKKCINGINDIIVTLKIPRGAIVFSINNAKCRTNKVIVLDIEDMDGNKVDRAFSIYNCMSYYVGDEITDYTFNCQYNIECSNGIHFFRTKKEAENYNL